MKTRCPYCDMEVSESAIEAEDGYCPECGSVISTRSSLMGDDDDYDDDLGDFDDLEDEDEDFVDDELDDTFFDEEEFEDDFDDMEEENF